MDLIEYLTENKGKPDNKTWDELGLRFGISGNAARKRWSRHIEDVSEEIIVSSTDSNHSLEGMIRTKTRELSPGKWVSSYERVKEENDENLMESLLDSFESVLNKHKGGEYFPIESAPTDKICLVAISDSHVGAKIPKECIIPMVYNASVFKSRINKMVEFVLAKVADNGPFNQFIMFDLGDALDGFNAMTSRTGHTLPQNLDNSEQWETYVDVLVGAWKRLVEAGVAHSYDFVGASNSNHAGQGFDYMAMQGVGKIINKLWGVEVYISKKFIDLYPVILDNKVYSYIFTHGKDKEDRRNGLPLDLDIKTKEYLQNIIDSWNVKGEIVVLKGDLHQSSTNRSHNGWWYENVPSIFGSSGWIVNNFTTTQPGFYFEILDKTGRSKGVVDV